jgi:hypothetical protein
VCPACGAPVSAGFVLAGRPGPAPAGRRAGLPIELSASGRLYCAWLCGWQQVGVREGFTVTKTGLSGGRFVPADCGQAGG